ERLPPGLRRELLRQEQEPLARQRPAIDERLEQGGLSRAVRAGEVDAAVAIDREGRRLEQDATTGVAPLRDGIPPPANGSRCRPTVAPLRASAAGHELRQHR